MKHQTIILVIVMNYIHFLKMITLRQRYAISVFRSVQTSAQSEISCMLQIFESKLDSIANQLNSPSPLGTRRLASMNRKKINNRITFSVECKYWRLSCGGRRAADTWYTEQINKCKVQNCRRVTMDFNINGVELLSKASCMKTWFRNKKRWL